MIEWVVFGILALFGIPFVAGLCYSLILRLGYDPLGIVE